MATTTGELRETLLECIDRVKAGKMDAGEAVAISKLAAQVNASLKIELDVRTVEADLARKGFGALPLGEEAQKT